MSYGYICSLATTAPSWASVFVQFVKNCGSCRYLPSNMFCHVQHALHTLCQKSEKHAAHDIRISTPKDPLVCHNAALKKRQLELSAVMADTCGSLLP